MTDRYFLFDAGNTLVNFDLLKMSSIMASEGSLSEAELLTVFHDNPLVHAVESGCLSEEEYMQEVNKTLGLQWDLERMTQAWQEIFTLNACGYGLFKRCIEAGEKVCICSNLAAHNAEALKRNWPDFFTSSYHNFLSFDMKKYKPNTDFYTHILNVLKAPPEYCLFVDDKAENIEAAEALGMRGVLFNERYADKIAAEVENFKRVTSG